MDAGLCPRPRQLADPPRLGGAGERRARAAAVLRRASSRATRSWCRSGAGAHDQRAGAADRRRRRAQGELRRVRRLALRRARLPGGRAAGEGAAGLLLGAALFHGPAAALRGGDAAARAAAGGLGQPAGRGPARSIARRSDGDFTRIQRISGRATVGELASDLYSGPMHRWDRVNAPRVKLYAGGLASASERRVLAGANAIAVRNPASRLWEVLQFVEARAGRDRGLRAAARSCAASSAPATRWAIRCRPGPSWWCSSRGRWCRSTSAPSSPARSCSIAGGRGSIPASDDAYLQGRHQGTRRGLRPYAPCDLRLRRVERDRRPG